MQATTWEFANRALIFGLIFSCSFALYALDHQTASALLANWLEPRTGMNAALLLHGLFALAALVLALAALIRTWGSSYLKGAVVYARDVKTELLVAEGPYRRVRNPLYFANVLMAIGLGATMSRSGFVLAVAAMVIFSYRLILREEAELRATHGASYEQYQQAVPRLWPALRPRAASAGGHAQWPAGFKAEYWCWGFAMAVAALAATLSIAWFYIILTASIVVLWLTSRVVRA